MYTLHKNEKQELVHSHATIFGVDFHQFLELEDSQTSLELAEEFGISLADIKKLKGKLKRS